MNNILFLLKPKVLTEYENLLPLLYQWLAKRKKNMFFLADDKDRISGIFPSSSTFRINFIELKDISKKINLLVTLGGDGTLIGAVRKLKGFNIPIVGINLGQLGFITEFSKNSIYETLETVLSGTYEVQKIQLYQTTIINIEGKIIGKNFFINDCVINKTDISRLIDLEVHTLDENIFNLRGDGLIISSPIGSTAYSLAAGGPIVSPTVNALVLSPICPHSLTHRPLVCPDDQVLQIKVPKEENNLMMTLDGQESINLNMSDRVMIRKWRSKFAHLIKNEERTYFKTLKEKFFHGRREL